MPQWHRRPKYRLHRPSGQAVGILSDSLGQRQDVNLGKYGTAESRREYRRVLKRYELKLKPGKMSVWLKSDKG